jgi:prephenate dehydratase
MVMINAETSPGSLAQRLGRPLRVAIQGYPGAFHEIAARLCFKEEAIELAPAHTFDELVAMLESGAGADVGLMAIENTLAGSLMYNYRLLYESSLAVTGEVYLRIKHNLLALPGQSIAGLKEVHSHPMAIAQCQEFFRAQPHIRLVETVDTALSAREISEGRLEGIGAIASDLAADMYQLQVLAAGIETNKKNYTRFLVVEKPNGLNEPPQPEKVSIVFAVDHTVGSLYKVLAVLAAYNINLTKIQSAPIIGSPWEYMFFVDFLAEGRVGYRQALDAIRPLTHNLKVLGAYKQGEHHEH